MICISKLPDVVDVNGKVVKSSMNSQVCWRELPGFAFYFREVAVGKSREGEKNPIVPFLSLPSKMYTCFPYFPFLFFSSKLSHTPTDVPPTPQQLLRGNPITWGEQVQKHTHANTFAALYLRALDSNLQTPHRDFAAMRNHAQWTLCEALEVPTDHAEQVHRTEMYVPAASQWILKAGATVSRFCAQRANNDGERVVQRGIGGDDGGEWVWGGEEGFGVERWAFGKKRFGEVGGLEGAEGVVRRLAAEAEEETGRIGMERAG